MVVRRLPPVSLVRTPAGAKLEKAIKANLKGLGYGN
jgi:hypothetical protein